MKYIVHMVCSQSYINKMTRRSPQGERGLKPAEAAHVELVGGRSPQGERGLKQAPYPGHGGLRGRSPAGGRGLKCVAVAVDISGIRYRFRGGA